MDQLSLQNLVDYLHTAVSENDLLFVYYWFKELEGRGEEGKQAIQSGKREFFPLFQPLSSVQLRLWKLHRFLEERDCDGSYITK